MIKLITIGASYGGMDALKTVIGQLPPTFKTPVLVVLHIGNNQIKTLISILNNNKNFVVKEAEEKEPIRPGTIYFAPPNYHLQVEDKLSLSLSTDDKVNFSRPSIDVLFETAAWNFGAEVLGVLLTGSNNDGAEGLETIQTYGGLTLVENPETACAETMPGAAINRFTPDYVVNLDEIATTIVEILSK